ncbi:uncharacterized protein TM35_000251420, partial [Trypanosoma theileri]
VLLPGSVEATKSPPFLCVLPVGDSITQGNQVLGSFRSYLNDLLLAEANKTNALIAGHGFMGFESDDYTTGSRALGRSSTFKMYHQAKWGWTSTQVLHGLENIFHGTGTTPEDRTWQKHYQDTFQLCLESAAETGKHRGVKLPVLVVTTLFVGHNDA